MNLILLDPSEVSGNEVILTDHRAEHIRSVLKAQPGQSVRIGILEGPQGSAKVDMLDQHKVVLRCVLEQNTPPRPPVDLLLALPRPKVMKRLWAQLAALGVGRIILTNGSFWSCHQENWSLRNDHRL